MRALLILSVILLLQACIPQSDNALTDPGKDIDTVLLGTWYWSEENETGYIHIGLDDKSKQLRLVMVDIDKNGGLDISEFAGHPSVVSGKRYLNLKYVRPEKEELTGYLFVKYSLKPDSLAIALMRNDPVKEAINTGALKGELKAGESSTIRITETQKKLQKFIIRNDKQLFSESQVLSRLLLPNKQK